MIHIAVYWETVFYRNIERTWNGTGAIIVSVFFTFTCFKFVCMHVLYVSMYGCTDYVLVAIFVLVSFCV